MTDQKNRVVCSNIFREANQVIDRLAKHSLSIQEGVSIFHTPPPWI